MKNPMFALLHAVVLSALAGCATVYRVSESAETPASPPARPEMRNPVVRVDVASAGEQSQSLAAAVKPVVEDSLAARGFSIAAKGAPDTVVALSLSRRSKDELADWRLYEGKADVRISEASSGKLVASRSFVANGERALDEEKAMKGVKDGLSKQILPWLEKALPLRKIALPPPPVAPSIAHVTIAPADLSEDPASVLAVQRRFMDVVSAHPGVADCRLVREMPTSRAYVFRVAYDPARFPGGLLNTIVLESPELGDNVKLEIVR